MPKRTRHARKKKPTGMVDGSGPFFSRGELARYLRIFRADKARAKRQAGLPIIKFTPFK